MIYRNNLKNREFGKEAPQNFCSERVTIADRQGTSENKNFEVKPTPPGVPEERLVLRGKAPPKTDCSSCFGIFRPLLDLFFPPICMHCSQFTSMPYLCKECWLESQLLTPEGRCLHCFEEIEEPSGLCSRCRHKPLLPFPRAALFAKEAPIYRLINREESPKPFAGYGFYQWLRLQWKEPDLIASIPPQKKKVAREFAELVRIPCPNLFRIVPWPLNPRRWEVKEQFIEDDMTILLIDEGCTLEELQMACRALAEAFPKNVYVLSLTL